MCGIFGHYNFYSPLTEKDIKDCRSALSLMAHRGPDAYGDWHDAQTYIGHRRLTIIDLSSAANQPFHDSEDRYILSYNGEIYNYIELKEEMLQKGIAFRTKSDTEVFLAAWKYWGIAALKKLNGMFAAAIFDRKLKQHYLLRDPLGQKPIYYHINEKNLTYSSELRGLLSLKNYSWQLDKEAFARFLMNGYYAWDETPIKGIKKLLPGCILQVTNEKTELIRYWDSIPCKNIANIDKHDAILEFENLFDSSCQLSMRSDVPYGLFLSGGIDSSLVLKSCQKTNPELRSFSVGMSEADFDESEKARLIVNSLGMKEHHIFLMDQTSVLSAVDDVFAHSDEPHGDPGLVNTLFLARSCKPFVTVALAGDGSDELFGGYAPFKGLSPIPWLEALPLPLINLFKNLVDIFPQPDSYLSTAFKLKSYLQGFPAEDNLRYSLWLASCELSQLAQICSSLPSDFFSPDGKKGTILSPFLNCMKPVIENNRQEMLHYFYQKVFLPEFVCAHTDRASMQTSMEVRSPFLSVPLVEFANQLPPYLKVYGKQLKWLPKQQAKKYGFPSTIYNQRKQGFTFPVARWLKGPLKNRMMHLLSEEMLPHQLVDTIAVLKYREDHLSGRKNNYRILYNLMAFQAWRHRYPDVQIL